MRSWISALVLLFAAGLSPTPAEVDTIDWSDNMVRAFKRAREQSRPLMVDVWAVWCAPCKEMEETTFADEVVIRFARESFVPLKVNADIRSSFIERYAIEAYPTLLFLDADGQELTRREGFLGGAALIDLAARVRGGYPEYIEALGGPDSAAAARALRNFFVLLGNEEGAVDVVRSMSRAARRSAPDEVPAIRLELGIALLEAGSSRAAAKILTELSAPAAPVALRGPALQALVRAERDRGKETAAAAALARLQAEFPELAQSLR